MSEANNPADAGLAETGSAQTDDISTEEFDRAPAPDDSDAADPADAQDTGEDAGDEDNPEGDEQGGEESDDGLVEYEAEDGQKYKVPVALKDHLLRRDDYTRKTQEVAAQRREIEEQAKAREAELAQKAESLETLRAEHTKVAVLGETIATVKAKVAEWENVDWDTWSAQVSGLPADDPNRLKFMNYSAAYTADRNRLASLSGQLEAAKNDLQTKETERLTKQREAAEADLAKQRQETGRVLAAEVEGWSAERAKQVATFMHTDLGLEPEEIGKLVDAKTWKFVDRLMKAEAKVATLEKAHKQQQTANNHEKAQGAKPAATPKGKGGQARDPSTARGDDLSTEEWLRRRAAQKGIKLR